MGASSPGSSVSSITQRSGKLTMAQAEELGSKASSLLNYCNTQPELRKLVHQMLADPAHLWQHSSRAVRGLGLPLVRMRGFESTPGLWVFDDTSSGIVFLLWSDGYKKHPWKGTSYEAVTTSAQEPLLPAAYVRLLKFLQARLPTATADDI